MIDVTIKHNKAEVHEAIVQFVARHSYRLTRPWYLDGLRIEAPDTAALSGEINKGFWASILENQRQPRIDIEIKRSRGNTILKIKLGDHYASSRLAYELQTHLNDERSYDAKCPPICPSCGSPVPNVIARYCGRCGLRLVSGNDPATERPEARDVATPMPLRAATPAPEMIRHEAASKVSDSEPESEVAAGASIEREEASAAATKADTEIVDEIGDDDVAPQTSETASETTPDEADASASEHESPEISEEEASVAPTEDDGEAPESPAAEVGDDDSEAEAASDASETPFREAASAEAEAEEEN